MKRLTVLVLLISLVAFITGCAGMSATQQRMLSGGAIGAGAGAAIGALTGGSAAAGAAIGGAAGVVGGIIVDQANKSGRCRN